MKEAGPRSSNRAEPKSGKDAHEELEVFAVSNQGLPLTANIFMLVVFEYKALH